MTIKDLTKKAHPHAHGFPWDSFVDSGQERDVRHTRAVVLALADLVEEAIDEVRSGVADTTPDADAEERLRALIADARQETT